MRTIRRGLPQGAAPAPRAATATAEVLTFERRARGAAALPPGFLDAVDAAHRDRAAAEARAAKDARLAELEQTCSDLRAEVRGLREALREADAATAAAVAEAERRARHELLGEARQTTRSIGGLPWRRVISMPSIRPRGVAR